MNKAKLNPLLRKAKREGWFKWITSEADERAVLEGCRFDIDKAEHACAFFPTFLRHSKGEFAGRPFKLLDFQRDDLISPVFGWMNKHGYRRFRTVYDQVAKKNYKSTLGAGIAMYLTVGDGEQGAEVYSAAADRDQASIIYREAANMAEASPALLKHLIVTRSVKHIGYPKTNSFYRALSSEVGTKEGLNIHGLLFDELHAQKTRSLWDALTYGGAARTQPLKWAMSTAGWDQESICYEVYQYAKDVLSGDIIDLTFYAHICEADKDDPTDDPKTWRKANPSLGITISLEDMEIACNEAKNSPRKENAFRRYRLNQWTEQAERWLSMDVWARGGADDPQAWRESVVERCSGESCTGGLDLGSTSDLTALVLLFGDADDGYDLLPWFWMPEGGVMRKDNTYREMYRQWIREGWVTPTEGDVADYSFIRRDINEIAGEFGLYDLAVDRLFQGAGLCTQLGEEDGLNIVPFGQGFYSMAAPSKRFEELVLEGKINHGSNPVLHWMASNVSVKSDPAGNIKPCKPTHHSPLKIDGIVAAIMALGRAMEDPGPGVSVYEQDPKDELVQRGRRSVYDSPEFANA